jgi:hypothetical protein
MRREREGGKEGGQSHCIRKRPTRPTDTRMHLQNTTGRINKLKRKPKSKGKYIHHLFSLLYI